MDPCYINKIVDHNPLRKRGLKRVIRSVRRWFHRRNCQNDVTQVLLFMRAEYSDLPSNIGAMVRIKHFYMDSKSKFFHSELSLMRQHVFPVSTYLRYIRFYVAMELILDGSSEHNAQVGY